MAETAINVIGDIEVPKDINKPGFFQLPADFSVSGPVAKQWLGQRRENIRPWLTFINTSNFKLPSSLPRLSKRILRNIEYFQSNYLFVFIGLFLYCLLTSPLLLIVVGCCLGFCYHLSKRNGERKLGILGKEISVGQQYALVGIFSVPLFMWAGAGAAVFWVLGASFLIITLHAAFFNIEAITQSDDEFPTLEQV